MNWLLVVPLGIAMVFNPLVWVPLAIFFVAFVLAANWVVERVLTPKDKR